MEILNIIITIVLSLVIGYCVFQIYRRRFIKVKLTLDDWADITGTVVIILLSFWVIYYQVV